MQGAAGQVILKTAPCRGPERKKDMYYRSDLGNGQFRNPVLFADYSDPDVIRVGDTYYMTASSFNYTPGLPILVSRDLISWTLAGYALESVKEAAGPSRTGEESAAIEERYLSPDTPRAYGLLPSVTTRGPSTFFTACRTRASTW